MSNDLDTILDRCIADIATGRETIDSCLRRYPAQAGWLAKILEITERVRTVPSTPLPADKRRALETRLLKRASQLQSKPINHTTAPHLPFWRRKWVLGLASFVVILLLLGTAAGASAASVPGDFLYPFKRTTEQVRLALVPEGQQADLHLEFAGQRLQEFRALTDRGEVSEELLAEISGETAQLLGEIPALPSDKQQALLTSLTRFQDQQLQVLENTASATQGEAQANVMAALADSKAKHQQAMDLLAGAASGDHPGNGSHPDNQPPGQPATVEEHHPAPGNPTDESTATDRPDPQATPKATDQPNPHAGPKAGPKATDQPDPQAMPQATKAAPAWPPKPAPDAQRMPPGQANQAPSYAPLQKSTKNPKK